MVRNRTVVTDHLSMQSSNSLQLTTSVDSFQRLSEAQFRSHQASSQISFESFKQYKFDGYKLVQSYLGKLRQHQQNELDGTSQNAQQKVTQYNDFLGQPKIHHCQDKSQKSDQLCDSQDSIPEMPQDDEIQFSSLLRKNNDLQNNRLTFIEHQQHSTNLRGKDMLQKEDQIAIRKSMKDARASCAIREGKKRSHSRNNLDIELQHSSFKTAFNVENNKYGALDDCHYDSNLTCTVAIIQQIDCEQTNSSEKNSQGAHIIDDFDSAIDELADSTIESTEVVTPTKHQSQSDNYSIDQNQNNQNIINDLQSQSSEDQKNLNDDINGSTKQQNITQDQINDEIKEDQPNMEQDYKEDELDLEPDLSTVTNTAVQFEEPSITQVIRDDDDYAVGLFKIPSANPLLKTKKKKNTAKQIKIAQLQREKEHRQIEKMASQQIQNQKCLWHHLSGIASEEEIEKSRIGLIGGGSLQYDDQNVPEYIKNSLSRISEQFSLESSFFSSSHTNSSVQIVQIDDEAETHSFANQSKLLNQDHQLFEATEKTENFLLEK